MLKLLDVAVAQLSRNDVENASPQKCFCTKLLATAKMRGFFFCSLFQRTKIEFGDDKHIEKLLLILPSSTLTFPNIMSIEYNLQIFYWLLDGSVHSMFIVTSSSVIDEDQNSYLKERKIDCGVVTGDKSEESSSRVMNAKPSTKTFSWTVQVTLKLYKDKQYISGNDKEYDILSAQGSFISDKAVITCAHCICKDAHTDLHNRNRGRCVCDFRNL